MIAKTTSCGLNGLDGFLVEVEADIALGQINFSIVGLPEKEVKEGIDRVRTAMKNCNLVCPQRRITINLAPANVKKEGAVYDLPISVAILAANNAIALDGLSDYLFLGELALDGRLRPVNGVLPMAIYAAKAGIKKVILPVANAKEAAVADIEVYPAENLFQVFEHLVGANLLTPLKVNIDEIFTKTANRYDIDFADVKGQLQARRAVEVAVAGGHNLLMIGSPGSGKSMIAKRILTILPDLTYNEALEITKVHSIAGMLDSSTSLMTTRPFRSPHHTISSRGLAGGGTNPKPGELSLAHNGVIFMDELPEFSRNVLEVMRQPLEDGEVTISRVNGAATYPCDALLVASMNPCKCGYHGEFNHVCKCTPGEVARYRGRVSGPLLDRIDIHINVPAIKYDDLAMENVKCESSSEIKERVDKARIIQVERYKELGFYSNSQLKPKYISEFCKLDTKSKAVLKKAFDLYGLSARAHDRILKVSRTIADLQGSENIQALHVMEAVQYRNLDFVKEFAGV